LIFGTWDFFFRHLIVIVSTVRSQQTTFQMGYVAFNQRRHVLKSVLIIFGQLIGGEIIGLELGLAFSFPRLLLGTENTNNVCQEYVTREEFRGNPKLFSPFLSIGIPPKTKRRTRSFKPLEDLITTINMVSAKPSQDDTTTPYAVLSNQSLYSSFIILLMRLQFHVMADAHLTMLFVVARDSRIQIDSCRRWWSG
jgi:hypothetical protein